jgi:hypothetical protein
MALNWTLELQGSEVQWAEALEEGLLRLRFSAAAVVVRQPAGAASEEGHVKGLELQFDQAVVTGGDPRDCIGALSDCSLHIDGVPQRHIPLPFEATGGVLAEFNFRSGSRLTLSARAVHCLPPADARFQTSYAC